MDAAAELAALVQPAQDKELAKGLRRAAGMKDEATVEGTAIPKASLVDMLTALVRAGKINPHAGMNSLAKRAAFARELRAVVGDALPAACVRLLAAGGAAADRAGAAIFEFVAWDRAQRKRTLESVWADGGHAVPEAPGPAASPPRRPNAAGAADAGLVARVTALEIALANERQARQDEQAQQQRRLGGLDAGLEDARARLDEHDGHLDEHDGRLNEHDGLLEEHDGRLNEHDDRLNEHDDRHQRHDGRLDEHDDRHQRQDGRLDEHDDRHQRHDDRLDEHDNRLDRNDARVDAQQHTIRALTVAAAAADRRLPPGVTIILRVATENEDPAENPPRAARGGRIAYTRAPDARDPSLEVLTIGKKSWLFDVAADDDAVLDTTTLSFGTPSTVLLLGHSGAGKTTMFKRLVHLATRRQDFVGMSQTVLGQHDAAAAHRPRQPATASQRPAPPPPPAAAKTLRHLLASVPQADTPLNPRSSRAAHVCLIDRGSHEQGPLAIVDTPGDEDSMARQEQDDADSKWIAAEQVLMRQILHAFVHSEKVPRGAKSMSSWLSTRLSAEDGNLTIVVFLRPEGHCIRSFTTLMRALTLP
ncbi:hypothetical protein DFH27DRAFT_656864 [Peziza echinospora]|nr:hypothetical protein DFH27DRAFT_656864 [Peziza echinospora]